MKFDEIGPEKILQVYDPETGMIGITVIDSTKRGPAKGGIRMTPTVSIEEVRKLARTMTYKNALADLPFGGGKSGIVFNPKEATPEKKQEIVAAFAKAIKAVCPSEYVAAPDINMAEHEMKKFVEANGEFNSTTGKPADLCQGDSCGIPHELGSTGYGVYLASLVAFEHLGLDVKNLTVAIEGWGNVGTFAGKFFVEEGAKLVAASDSKGTIYNPEGLDPAKLNEVKAATKTVTNYGSGQVMKSSDLLELPVDVLILAALPDVIHEQNWDKVKAKVIVEGSNIPMTAELEKKLEARGVLIIPDFVANSGGVISSYVEYAGGKAEEVFPMIKEKIVPATRNVLAKAKEKSMNTRDAALELAKEMLNQ